MPRRAPSARSRPPPPEELVLTSAGPRDRWRVLSARVHLTPARLSLALGVVVTLALVVPLTVMWHGSRLPDSYDMAAMGYADYGGGPHGTDMHPTTPVADLVVDSDRPADVETTLTVHQDGDRFTVNGTTPGPTITAAVGDLVQVTLVNDNVSEGTTLHWHGVDVPNAVDGVAGVTQDAVAPGERFVYRFVADHVGTYWYHSHQVSHAQVAGGLLGALVVLPERPDPAVLDQLAVLHEYDESTLNGEPGTTAVDAQPGQDVRVRVVNTNNGVAPVWVTGAPYRVLAVDGYDLNQPTDVTDVKVLVPAGGRYDLGLTVPEGGVRVDFAGVTALTFGGDPAHGRAPSDPEDALDLLSYGAPAALDFDPVHPDRRFDYSIGRRPGFLDGRPGRWWTVNGHLFPDTPMYMVDEGDVVVFEIENHSGKPHPMHLHGHHAVVLSRDGKETTGSPWWVDSLEIPNGHRYEVAFVADNPGIWMDHCHNLPHAAQGLVSHLMYMGVESSYRIGGEPGNRPE